MKDPLFTGKDLYRLIPQRPPIVMVDTLWSATDTEAETGLHIDSHNIFVKNNLLREPGIIEHIAQSVAAFKGYDTFRRDLPPKLGYIGEIKKCMIHSLPQAGSELHTRLQVVAEAAGITLVAAQVVCDTKPVADCQMKLFIKTE